MKYIRNFLNFLGIKHVIVGAAAIIENSKGEILLGKRVKNHIFYPDTWGLPGGLLDYKEKSNQTVIREVKEEIGVDMKIIKKSNNVYENLPNKEFNFQTITFIYYGKIISGTPNPKDETSEIKWFKPNNIKNLKLAYNHKDILKKEDIIK